MLPPITQTPSGADLATPVTVPSTCSILPPSSMGAKTQASRSGTWPTLLQSLSFTIIASELGPDGLC